MNGSCWVIDTTIISDLFIIGIIKRWVSKSGSILGYCGFYTIDYYYYSSLNIITINIIQYTICNCIR